jgi:hypothetical protein
MIEKSTAIATTLMGDVVVLDVRSKTMTSRDRDGAITTRGSDLMGAEVLSRLGLRLRHERTNLALERC